MSTPHRATTGQWLVLERQVETLGCASSRALLELRARIEALEAQQQREDKLDRLIALDAADPTPDAAMTVPLSPAAQSVIAASNCAGSRVVQLHIAAALRAAADQVVPASQSIDRADDLLRQGDILWDDATASICRRKLLAIATELDPT